MKRWLLLAALSMPAMGLAAIVIGDTEVNLGADIRSRYQDFDGYFDCTVDCTPGMFDFGALDMRFRVWASADITDTISFATRIWVADGELGTDEEMGAFNSVDESLGVEHAYIVWHNEWGDVYLGRIPAAAVGNDLVLDSWRYDGNAGAWEGLAVIFTDFEGFDVAFVYIDDNTLADTTCPGSPGEDCGNGIAAKVSFAEMIGWNLHIGFEELNKDMAGGVEYNSIFAGANIELSDVADLELSWIDGDMEIASGNAFLIRMDYEVNDDVAVHAGYGKTEAGAIATTGCFHDGGGGVCGGFGFMPSDLESIHGAPIGYPSSGDGDMWTVQVSWGNHWTLSYITWDDDAMDVDADVLQVIHEVVL